MARVCDDSVISLLDRIVVGRFCRFQIAMALETLDGHIEITQSRSIEISLVSTVLDDFQRLSKIGALLEVFFGGVDIPATFQAQRRERLHPPSRSSQNLLSQAPPKCLWSARVLIA